VISLKLEGLEGLNAQLRELKALAAARVLTRAARLAFAPVLETAKALVPVDTGLTRDNIKLQVQKPKGAGAVLAVGLRIAAAKGAQKLGREVSLSPHWRWHFIELGTSKMAAKPFLRPALDQNAARVLETLKRELLAGIQRALRRQRKGASK